MLCNKKKHKSVYTKRAKRWDVPLARFKRQSRHSYYTMMPPNPTCQKHVPTGGGKILFEV